MRFEHSAGLTISREAAVRFLLGAQDLDGRLREEATHGSGTAAALRQVRRLECVQIDPVAAVERNQHLVLAARLPGYRPPDLEALLGRGFVFEYVAHAACVIPIEDYPIFEGTRRRHRRRYAPELAKLRGVVREVVAELETHGPRPARAFVSKRRVRGWWDTDTPKTKATSHVLSMLLRAGAVSVVKRDGLERHFDLAERLVPAAVQRAAAAITTRDADEALLEKYFRAYRLFDADDGHFGWRAMGAAGRRQAIQRRLRTRTVVPITVKGIRRPYFARAEDTDVLRRHDRRGSGGVGDAEMVRFLPPLDNLLWRRERVADLFGFEYRWEVYLPQAKRRYGYYTMPILCGGDLIGRMDPCLDRERGCLEIRELHLEPHVRPTEALRRRLRDALVVFARFHGARDLRMGRAPAGLRP